MGHQSLLSTELYKVLDDLPGGLLAKTGIKYTLTIRDKAEFLDAVTNGSETASVTHALKALTVLFLTRAISPNDASYTEVLQQNWSTTCWLPAACYVKLDNAVEVALALHVITYFQVKFSVRSGGHNSNPGFSSIGGSGILLDLSSLDSIELSGDRSVVSVGPGATWDQIYERLEKHNLTVVGGRVAGVGVGGLVLGGRMSHFSNHWGLACDHVRNFEVVLADSRIVQANSSENVELFHALKGGGPNFGIVTRFDLIPNEDTRIWYTIKVYSHEDKEEVIAAAARVQEEMNRDSRIGFFLTVTADALVAGLLYLGGSEGSPRVFDNFSGVTPVALAIPETNGTQMSLVRSLDMGLSVKSKRASATKTLRLAPELYARIPNIMNELSISKNISMMFTIQPLGAASVEKSKALGCNCLNVPSENQAWIVMSAQWIDDVDDEQAWAAVHQFASRVENLAQQQGALIDFLFMNDSGPFQLPLKSYGMESFSRLKEASRTWDPHGVFQKLQYAGYLLRKT